MASRPIRKLRQLFDVDADSIADGETLVWDDGTDTFVPGSASTGAPTTGDYLVGTAQGELSAEIVVGATPGGELGGTWAAPTVDATHSGSSHATVQSAAEATAAAALSAHLTDTADAHDATAVSFVPSGSIAATEVQAAIEELAADVAASGAPNTADYLVGTAQGGLSAEIVAGTSPGGELGGTWASPTVDATHSGSSHAGVQAAAEASAAAALSAHEADTTSVHGLANTANLYAAGGTDVAVADGGTGSSSASGARTNLGLVIDTDVPSQASVVLKSLFDAQTVLAATTDNTPAAVTMGASTTLARLAAGNIVAATTSEMRTLLDVPTTGEAVLDTLFDANTVLAADSDNTPAALTMGASTILARLAAGNIKAATPAELRTLLDVPTNAEAILDAIVDAKGDMVLGTAADTVARLAAGANGTVPTYQSGQTTGILPQFPPGYEYAYVQATSNQTTTQTTQASATTWLTAPSITFDGSTLILIEFYTSRLQNSTTAQTLVDLWEDTTDLTSIARMTSSAGGEGYTVLGQLRITPTSGAKVYTIRAWVSGASTGTALGGTGTAAGSAPVFLRITRV